MINFTQQHLATLQQLFVELSFSGITFFSKMGTPLNVYELLHTTTIKTIEDIFKSLKKQIENLEDKDEWVSTSETQNKINDLKIKKEFINLLIGYKRYILEQKEISAKKEELIEKLNDLKESQKTPDDRIKELEAQIAELG